MNKTAGVVSLAIAVLIGASGCSTLRDTGANALQGRWNGREIGAAPETPRLLVISGSHMEYRGAEPNDWGKGTFTLRGDAPPRQLVLTLTECGFPQYIGTTCCMIYQVENGTLTTAANEPGNPAAPVSFDAPGARQMVFQKE